MKTIFTLIETANMDTLWECNCEPPHTHVPTVAVEKYRKCRRCGAQIDEFVDELNEE